MNYYTDSKELQFLFRNAIDWDTILPLYYPSFPTKDGFKNKEEIIAFFEDMLTTVGKWSAETLYPRARELDKVGGGTLSNHTVQLSEPLRKTYAECVELGLFGITGPEKHGGLGLPIAVGLSAFALIFRACTCSATQISFHTGIVDMLERFCDEPTRARLIPLIIEGKISGSMCLTEPGAGSDVGSLRTKATKQADGSYLLNGTKCFITNGGGGLGFILARIEGAPDGLNGISLFLAEEYIRDSQSGEQKKNYKITKIEDKMGMKGSPTCEVVYENTVAYLIGEENTGLQKMFHLMNEARITVGVQSAAGINAALHYARSYAETRSQFGKNLLELPLYKRNMEDWETERDAIQVLVVEACSHFDIFQRLDMMKKHGETLTPQQLETYEKAKARVRQLTPLAKAYPSEAFVHLSQRAIQALGGYGFMKEYDAERFHRDSFGPVLYEGTTQIQSQMATKDFLNQLTKNPKKFLQSFLATHPLGTLMAPNDNEYKKSFFEVYYELKKNLAGLILRCFKSDESVLEALGHINRLFKRSYWMDEERIAKLIENAETLCQALSYTETLKILSKQASRYPERGELYYRYHNLITPRLAAIYTDWKNRT